MKKCLYCKLPIHGKYLQYGNKFTVCLKCDKTLVHCSICKIPLRASIRQNGKSYCNECLKKAQKCYYCDEYIFGQYYKVSQNNICKKCYEKAPRCVRCNIPVKEYLVVNKQNICIPCSQAIDYCAVCQIPLINQFYKYSGSNRKFCKDCSQKRNKCVMCAMPLTKKYHQLKDKRVICSLCMKTAVKTSSEAQKILQIVLTYLKQNYSMNIRNTIKLNLVDSKTLLKIRGKSLIKAGKKDRRALGIFLRKGESFDVYIEKYLPYALCLGTLAHEYTHAWQADHFPKNASILYIEGMAEWIAYNTLLHCNYKKDAKRILTQKDIYGQGLKRIKKLEKKYPKKQIINKILQMAGRVKIIC